MYRQNSRQYPHQVLTQHFLMSLYLAVDYIWDSENDVDFRLAMKYQLGQYFELQMDYIHPNVIDVKMFQVYLFISCLRFRVFFNYLGLIYYLYITRWRMCCWYRLWVSIIGQTTIHLEVKSFGARNAIDFDCCIPLNITIATFQVMSQLKYLIGIMLFAIVWGSNIFNIIGSSKKHGLVILVHHSTIRLIHVNTLVIDQKLQYKIISQNVLSPTIYIITINVMIVFNI